MITPGRRERLLAALTVVALATLLPELTSANTSVDVLLRPVPLLLFAVLYGVPALVLREVTVRTSSGLAGLFVGGLAYGVLNEALLSKTSFRPGGLPVELTPLARPELGWGWLAFLAVWQALASIVFPVAIAHSLFPWQSNSAWLNRVQLTLLALPALGLAVLIFLSPQGGHDGTAVELAGWLGLVTVLLVVAGRLRGPWAVHPGRLVPALLGGPGLVVFLTAAVLLAGLRPPDPVFVLLFGAGVAAVGWAFVRLGLGRLPGLGVVALGWYVVTALFAHRAAPDWSLAVTLLVLTLAGVGVGRVYRRLAALGTSGSVASWSGASGPWSRVWSWWRRVAARRPRPQAPAVRP